MISLGTMIFFTSEESIRALMHKLVEQLDDEQQQNAVKYSFEKLRAISRSLQADVDYMQEENPIFFKDYMEDMKNVLKIIFQAFPPGPRCRDNIDSLRKNFFDTLARMSGEDVIFQKYASISSVIRFVRNMEEHANKPTDHITGKRSYGNLFTLVSILVLLTYAYKEILEAWLESVNPVGVDQVD